MSDIPTNSVLRSASALLATAFVLTGCLSEESATGNDSLQRETTLLGSVGDGPLVGATVTVYASDGIELGSIQSDSGADYIIDVMTDAADFPLTVEALGGTDLVTGQAPDFSLRSAVPQSVSRTVVNANPFSTIIYELADSLPGGLNAANISRAEQIVLVELNSGISSLGGDGPVGAVVDSGNIAEIVRSSEALSEVIRRTRDLHTQFASTVDGDQIVLTLAADLTDDVIDGRGNATADARAAAISTIVSAQVLLETIANELHVNGSDATAAMRNATENVSATPPQPSIDELVATGEMLMRIRIGLTAAYAITQDPAIAELHSSVTGLQPGLDAMFVRNLLPGDYRSRLENALVTVASGNSAMLETVNDIARTRTVTITESPNNPPIIAGMPVTSVEVGSAYSFTPQASDADGDILTFDIVGQPVWASFDSTTGALSGTPSVAGTSSNIVISVSDGQAIASLPAFDIVAFAENAAPVISGMPPVQASVGQPWSFTPDATDPNGDTLTFNVENAPPWAAFDSSSGTLSGTPGAGDVGIYADIRITVSDGELSDSLVFAVEVSAGNRAPTISGIAAASVEEGQPYAFVPTANDPDGDPLTFSIGNRPSWANFNSSTGALSGTPQVGDAGVYANILITVTDGMLSDTLTFTVEVTSANTVPQISGNPPPSVTVGETYTFRPTASDADGDVLTFSVANLPPWAGFDTATGEISGTPGAGDVGTWAGISISVSDGQDNAGIGPFSIDVIEVGDRSATLSWTPPTLNVDGTAVTDLAGYRLYYGTSSGNYTNEIEIDNPSITTYVVENLSPGTYYFVVTAFNSVDEESGYSNEAVRDLN